MSKRLALTDEEAEALERVMTGQRTTEVDRAHITRIRSQLLQPIEPTAQWPVLDWNGNDELTISLRGDWSLWHLGKEHRQQPPPTTTHITIIRGDEEI